MKRRCAARAWTCATGKGSSRSFKIDYDKLRTMHECVSRHGFRVELRDLPHGNACCSRTGSRAMLLLLSLHIPHQPLTQQVLCQALIPQFNTQCFIAAPCTTLTTSENAPSLTLLLRT
eukprot:364263-Chlamydomonas_euryale.AAC.11